MADTGPNASRSSSSRCGSSPGSKVNLAKDFDPGYKAGFLKKKDGVELLQTGIALLADYQARLAAQDTYGVLVCLQALDAGGKDGTIRHVMSGVNPQGVQVERLQGALRRGARPRLPVALRPPAARPRRDRDLQPVALRGGPRRAGAPRDPRPPEAAAEQRKGKGIWERRYREINDWERYLTDNGFKVVKLFLNLSKEEQRTRFLKRIDLPEKNWKFSAADVRERRRWDDYQKAFSEMLSAHQHRVGAVVRHPGGPQVVRAHLRGGGARAHADRDRPAVPDGQRGGQQDLLAARRELEAEAPEGRSGRSVRGPCRGRRTRVRP